MKKMKWSFAALALFAMCSAFVGAKTTQDLYYNDQGTMRLITTEGECFPVENPPPFCKYTLKEGHSESTNPADYDGVTGTENQIWVP